MSREEIQKLLGGYATDTLSESERRALFEAALEDQDLFDALAQEQALRDVLHDPSARQQLIAALSPARGPFAARAWQWLRQPAALAMATGIAGLLIVGGLALRQTRRPAQDSILMTRAVLPEAAQPQPAPLPAPVNDIPAPVAAQRKEFHPPAALAPKPPAPLPAPPALAEARPGAPPPLPADTAEVKRESVQATPAAGNFVARDGPRLAAMVRAKAAPSAAAKPAVDYTLLLKDAGGAYAPAPVGTVFHPGDSVRLLVVPADAGTIELYRRGPTAAWDLVTSQRVEKGRRYELPAARGVESDVPARVELWLRRLDAPAGLKITLEFR